MYNIWSHNAMFLKISVYWMHLNYFKSICLEMPWLITWSNRFFLASWINNVNLVILTNSDIVELWKRILGVLLIIDSILAIRKLKTSLCQTSYKWLYLYLKKYTNLGKLHGFHYVPFLNVVLLDIFQEESYQTHHHRSRHKRRQ